jgi:hypothetical protein
LLPAGETPLPLGKAAPAPIEPTKEELRALVRRLGADVPPGDNLLAHLVGKAAFEAHPDNVTGLARIAKELGKVMRRPPEHALQIMAAALKRAGMRHLFGAVRRHFEAEAAAGK